MSQIRCFHGNAECRACGIEPEWTAEDERAAVVKWLRYEAEMATGTNTTAAFQHAARLDTLADDIERGEHRSEGGEAVRERFRIEHIRMDTYAHFPEDKHYFVVRRTAADPDGEAFAMFWTREDAELYLRAVRDKSRG